MEPIKRTAYDIIQLRWVYAFNFQPLAVLNQLQNVGARADAVRQPACGIPRQTEQRDNPRSIRMQLRVVSRLIVKWDLRTIFVLLDDRADDGRSAVFVVVDPWFLRHFVPFTLLNSIELDFIII